MNTPQDLKKTGKPRNVKLQMLGFVLKNMNYLKFFTKLEPVKTTLGRANMELGKIDPTDGIYHRRVKEFDQAMIYFIQARWYAVKAMETKSASDWRKAFQLIQRSLSLGQQIYDSLRSGTRDALTIEETEMTTNGTEIKFAGEVPLIPEICPIVILRGNDYEMGYQYAQQIIEIFGRWIFERKAGQKFTPEELDCMKKWEDQVREHAPETLDMIRGWAAGATDAGVRMSYEDVLDMWVGHVPPKQSYYGKKDPILQLPTLGCSGSAAWGQATKDGKLVTGSSGDFDPAFTATIVAFPENGNSYIFTPFSATGDLAILGNVHLFGHPGMNNKGVAYVHHGGTPKMIEPKKHWGYGLRRTTSVLHSLRYANSAKEALEIEMTYPIGDVGLDSGTTGGFYADSSYGFVLESRKDPVIIREAGVMGETDFLYANNSAIHPDAVKAGWMQGCEDDWTWDPHGGWRPKVFKPASPFSIPKRGESGQISAMLNVMYFGSQRRNQYMFNMLDRGLGQVDFEYMKMMFRKTGTLPAGTWEEISKQFKKTGAWGEVSTGNSMNGPVVVMKPDGGDEGLYAVCVSEPTRGMTPTGSMFGAINPCFAETNAFWEIKLAASPEGVAAHARVKAQEYIDHACQALQTLKPSDTAYAPLKAFLDEAQDEYQKGLKAEAETGMMNGNGELYRWSKAVRAFTRAQVRALQTWQAIVPPARKPEDLAGKR